MNFQSTNPDEEDDVLDFTEDEDEDTQESGNEDEEDLSPEARQILERRLAAERARLEEEFAQHKANYGRRFNRLNQSLLERGLDVAEDGTLVTREPQKVLGWIGASKPEGQDQEKEDNTDDIPDPTYAPAQFQQWLARQVEQATKPLVEQIQKLDGSIVSQRASDLIPEVEEYLVSKNYGGAVKHPDFPNLFRESLRQTPEPFRNTEQGQRLAATMAAMMVEQVIAESGGDTSQTQHPKRLAEARRAASQAGLPTRGNVSTKPRPVADQVTQALARASGMTVEEYELWGQEDDSDPITAANFKSRLKTGKSR